MRVDKPRVCEVDKSMRAEYVFLSFIQKQVPLQGQQAEDVLEQTPRTTIVQTQSITTNLSGTTHQTVL